MTERQVLVLNADTISWSPTAIMTKEILQARRWGPCAVKASTFLAISTVMREDHSKYAAP